MLWCRATFQREFDSSMCRLFSTQKQLFDFIDAEAEKQRLALSESVAASTSQEQWHLFSIEFPSEDEVAQRLSHSPLTRINNNSDHDNSSRCEELLHWQLFTERHKFRPHATLLASPSKQIKMETKVNEVVHHNIDDDDGDDIIVHSDMDANATTKVSEEKTNCGDGALEVKRTWGSPRKDFIVWYGEHSLSTQTRFFLAATRRGLVELHKRLPPLQRHLYEIIREGLPCHVYLDVERTDDYCVFKNYVDVDGDGDDNVNVSLQTSIKERECCELEQKMEEESSSSQESVCLISDDDDNNGKNEDVKLMAMNESKSQFGKQKLTLYNKQNSLTPKIENNTRRSTHKTISITAYMAQGSYSYNSGAGSGGSSSERHNYVSSVEDYVHTVNAILPSSIPAHSCPLTCHVTPDNSQTERVLLRELASFVQSQFPQLVSHLPQEVSTKHNSQSEENCVQQNHNEKDDKENDNSKFIANTFAEVMVMRSLPMSTNCTSLSTSTPNVNTHSDKANVPFKFSQHYTVKLGNSYVADNNFTVGELIRQFVEYLHRRVEDGDEEVHAALFYHAEPLLYKCATSQVNSQFKEKHQEGKHTNVAHHVCGVKNCSSNSEECKKPVYVPFYQRKCVIDCAVYSRNRTMRCLGSCKLNKDSVLQIETHIKNKNSLHACKANNINQNNCKDTQSVEETQNTFVREFFASLICAYHDEEIEFHQSNSNNATCSHKLFHLDPISDKHYRSLTHHNMAKSPSPSPCSRSKSVSLTPQPSDSNKNNYYKSMSNQDQESNARHCESTNVTIDNYTQEPACTAQLPLATPQLTLDPQPHQEYLQEQQPQHEENPLYDEAEVVNELQTAYSAICNRACIVHKPLVISDRFISYQVTGTHYCQNIHREHKSNNIYIVLDRKNGTWVQKCFDPDCASFRSAPQKLQTMQQHLLE